MRYTNIIRVWNCLVFLPFGDLFGDSRFCPFSFAICRILNLEAAISTVFAASWTSNLSLSIVFAHFHGICSILALEAVISAVLIFTWLFHSVHCFSTVFIDSYMVFIDSYMVFIDFFEVLIDFWKYTMCKL